MGCLCHAPAALPREKDLVPIVKESGWVPGMVRMGVEYLKRTGIRSPDRSAQLRYSAHVVSIQAEIHLANNFHFTSPLQHVIIQ
jgi:hypothetical protein